MLSFTMQLKVAVMWGIIQQYIFYYAREIKLGKPAHKAVHQKEN